MDPTHRGAARATALFAGALALALTACDNDPAGPAPPAGPDPSACDEDPAPPQCPGGPGTFAFLPELALPIAFADNRDLRTRQGDFDGDGRMDIAFNEVRNAPALNRVHVAFGQADGGFTVSAPADHGEVPPEGWESFDLLVGDVDGDGRDDLIWNHLASANVVYSGLSAGSAGFDFGRRQVHTNLGWTAYTAAVGDMNGDGRDDIVWNARTRSLTSTYIGFSTGSDGDFTMVFNRVNQPGDYSVYNMVIGRFAGDSDGILLNGILTPQNDTRLVTITATPPTFSIDFTRSHNRGDWGGFGPNGALPEIGDFDGVQGEDILWYDFLQRSARLRTAINNGSGTFEHQPGTEVIFPETIGAAAGGTFLGDFNGDGVTDILLNAHAQGAETNYLIVGLGSPNGFVFPTDLLTHPVVPEPDWRFFFDRFAGDVNGDGQADMVWLSPRASAVFVALARPVESA